MLRGRLLCPDPAQPKIERIVDGLLTIGDDGRIMSVAPAPDDCALPESYPGAVILPGFVDAHVHFPQTRVIGSASGPLLRWLERSVFPEELRFQSVRYAAVVAYEFCEALVRHGTTCAAIYGSSHEAATDVLFQELDRRGLRALVGMTLMDRGAPPGLLVGADEAIAACERLVDRWHGHDGRLGFCVTPRFALSCTPELLRRAGRLADARGLHVQTHLSENTDELRHTAAAFPAARDYLEVYESHGLAGPRSLFAHCIHLSDGEWDRLAAGGSAVAHCPDSNFFLGSGCMRLRSASERSIRVGLGTDVGAGRSFSLRQVIASAYDASLIAGAPTTAEELLWLATRGGACALGMTAELGCLRPGFEADLAVIDAPEIAGAEGLFDALAFRRDAAPARAVFVRGALLRGAVAAGPEVV
ncbi:guanine deaminase [Nannocystis sp. SCPEA4]|uniref:guanine deaminase n=1 Tax=Nannocystis sp. SCPEA4 TaxID=2996787 RepID=UPI0022712DD5|nr:guanine deaminase [Nannocystis sp. SCPEA4]